MCVCACLCLWLTADIEAGQVLAAIDLAFFRGPRARATSTSPSAPSVRGGACVFVCVCQMNIFIFKLTSRKEKRGELTRRRKVS